MSEFQALIESNRRLAESVETKVSEIDREVERSINELNNAFPSKYLEFAVRTHYVDCINGNDKNDGLSSAKALRTIGAALAKGEGASSQSIRLSKGIHVVSGRHPTTAAVVLIGGDNQSHYPGGEWSAETSTIIHIDKRSDIRNGISTKLFGNLYVNNSIVTFEGQAESESIYNTAFSGIGNIGLRLPLFVFDSPKRGIMTAENNYNPFSSLGCELPQFSGEAAFYVKGTASTCILNLDRAMDRTSGMQQKFGSVVVLS
ncbi:hypothetical protein [Vibrio cholerae]